ncbi:FAD/NAD(P)-binding domain-containing protein [Pleurostoma richardsiae]|uniref:FAD/NAD(P)-binding domain-containing protein n=1 Tax=Pleurostoma richardsiae TaxID=41990 RepID=A0AA38REE5_9PEZI|nr:FAD/NAD(P)-binding domain-containing protein [Pleurostoma richardsiae]
MKYETHDHVDVYDVVIIGAGISGINVAHHLQSKLPSLSYAILEGRDCIGGTWDLFRYPGIRSDTDLFTFGFAWSPWTENRAIADGQSIKKYLSTTAEKEGIHSHIRFQHRVVSANWVSVSQCWDLQVQIPGGTETCKTRFVFLGTGYYDYEEPLKADIPGLYDNFKGKVVHPQFWPEDLDYSGKEVVVIGSGATAITLLPNLATKAGHVTMLQRSPTYIMSIDNAAGNSLIHRILPRSWSFKLSRLMFMWTTAIIFYLCRAFPTRARSILQGKVAEQLPKSIPLNPHFQPTYRPWDQRLCFTPNGDFFDCLRAGKASVATGQIENVTKDTIVLKSGQEIKAEIIITATGLKLALGGRIQVSLDGKPVDLADRYAWNMSLLQDVPNMAFMIGYVNASWTLGAETTGQLVCRLLKHMQRKGYTSVIPRLPAGSRVQPQLMWNLDATYVKQAASRMPKCGDIGPWRGRTNYFADLWRARHGNITKDLEFSKGSSD